MSKQLDIFIESLGTLLSPFVIDYNFILLEELGYIIKPLYYYMEKQCST